MDGQEILSPVRPAVPKFWSSHEQLNIMLLLVPAVLSD
jgi:hypothetical protein